MLLHTLSLGVPLTYEEAMSSTDSEYWKRARKKEMKALKKNDTYELTLVPKDKE